jgi:hypothetical protein
MERIASIVTSKCKDGYKIQWTENRFFTTRQDMLKYLHDKGYVENIVYESGITIFSKKVSDGKR